jgi:hypothetical protein
VKDTSGTGQPGKPDRGLSRKGLSFLPLAIVASAAIGIGGLILVAGFVERPACGCATAADPNWTPPPVTASEAAVYAAKIAGLPSMSADLGVGPDGRSLYVATAPDAIAFVDAVSGSVVEVVLEDRMPNDATVAVSGAGALAVAQVFLEQRGTTDLVGSFHPINQAGVAAYLVTWSDAAGVAKLDIAVNASTGDVFAYVDLGPQMNATPPLIGRARAIELAIAAFGVPGETVTSAELAIDLVTGSQVSSWDVGLGVPTASQADVFERGALIRIDAVTGEATVVKS